MTDRTEPPARIHQTALLPILFMLGASALVAGTSLLAKALGAEGGTTPPLHPLQVSAGRFCFALLALCAFVVVQPARRPPFRNAPWRLHLARSVCGWLGVSCMFAAVARMPLADATAITFLNPIVAMILAVLLLGERLDIRKLVATALALLGAALILRPGSEAFQTASLMALAAAGFLGLESIIIKRLSDREPALRVLLINNAIGAVLSVSAALVVWRAPDALQWGLLAALGCVMVCAQAMFIQSMKRGEASLVMPALYSVLVFAALYDFLIYATLPSPLAAIGAALIVSGAILLALRRRRQVIR